MYQQKQRKGGCRVGKLTTKELEAEGILRVSSWQMLEEAAVVVALLDFCLLLDYRGLGDGVVVDSRRLLEFFSIKNDS